MFGPEVYGERVTLNEWLAYQSPRTDADLAACLDYYIEVVVRQALTEPVPEPVCSFCGMSCDNPLP